MGLYAVNRHWQPGFTKRLSRTEGLGTISIEGTIQSWRAFDHQNIQTGFMRSGSDRVPRHEGPVTAGII